MSSSDYVFSPSAVAFYPVSLRKVYEEGSGWPLDAVPISTALYERILAGQESGKRISVDSSGLPMLVDPPRQTSSGSSRGLVHGATHN